MDYKKLIIRGISYSQNQSGSYILLLEQPETSVKLPIIIGSFEAQSISVGLEKDIYLARPLTHDLFKGFLEQSLYTVESIIIYKIIDGVFFSHINFKYKVSGEIIKLDSRTSDAVALSVRFDAPIFVVENVLSEAGILLNIEEETEEEEKKTPIKSMTELENELEEAVRNEDFDLALKIQEEIKFRTKNID